MKYLTYFVVVILLISSFAAIGLGKDAKEYDMINVNFSNVQRTISNIDNTDFYELTVDGANAILYNSGEPMLPMYTKTFVLPFGTKITDIRYELGELKNDILINKILPTPKPMVLGREENPIIYEMDELIYQNNDYFPNNWFNYYTGGGLDANNEHKTFFTLRIFPVRYNPVTNNIRYIEKIDLMIEYNEPTNPLLSGTGEYDMVIISPSALYDNSLQNFIEHKNNYGINTIIKTTEEIYDEYDGVDKPEQIKYFIKDAIETWDIKYILLVGGLNSPLWAPPRDDSNQGTLGWYLPVRYTNLKEVGGTHDPGFISDLYYADIYDSEGNFSTWDEDRNGNSDGVFANWKFPGARDMIDLYPDVYVGRIPCRNVWEVKIITNKIIDYETNSYNQDWFNKIIGIGGDSHDDFGTDYNEGEEACDYIFENYMSDFDQISLFASYKDTDESHIPSGENIVREISEGAGFLLFEGHGHPGSWNTHWPGEFNWDDTPGGITCYDFPKISNQGKYPIMVVGGCHNNQFNISLIGTVFYYYLKNSEYMWTHGYAYAECFGWNMARKVNGGSIASFGNTGLGYGAVGNHGDLDGDGEDLPDTLEALGGYQIAQFFKTYNEGVDILGEVWGGAETKYLNTFPGMDDQTDCKTVEQWPLIGDPSLKIGGYPS
jgi:hypothetical protein